MKKLDLYLAVQRFFTNLIDATDTYFLSDYVETELVAYVDEDTYNSFMTSFYDLQNMCKDKGLDMHKISQDVASIYMRGVNLA